MNPLNYMRLHDHSSRNPRQQWTNASNGKIRCVTLQRHFNASTKFAHVKSRFCGRTQRGKAVFCPLINPCARRARSRSVAVGVNGNAAFGWLRHRGVAFKKTLVFLIPPAYQKTPHKCKGLQGQFRRGFFEGLIYLAENGLVTLEDER
jgi:hypothetical protein